MSFDEKLDALIDRRRALASEFLAPMPTETDLEKELFDDLLGGGSPTTTSHLPPLRESDVRLLTWDRFEALIAALWSRQGFETITTVCGWRRG